MAGLNKELKEYLSRSETYELKKIPTSKNGTGLSCWVKDKIDVSNFPPHTEEDTSVTNGWFNGAEKDFVFSSMSKRQRILGFMGCVLMGFFCFTLAGLYVPFLMIKARKFSLLYTLGSIFIIASFSLLWGPFNHIKHLFSMERLPFTSVYFGTMMATLYSALWLKSTLLAALFALFQVIALIWYIISYIPGGQTGLKFFTMMFTAAASKTAGKVLPI